MKGPVSNYHQWAPYIYPHMLTIISESYLPVSDEVCYIISMTYTCHLFLCQMGFARVLQHLLCLVRPYQSTGVCGCGPVSEFSL